MQFYTRSFIFVLGVLAPLSSFANSLTLYNSGMDSSGLLADGAVDSPWTVSPVGAGNGTCRVLSAANRDMSGQWIPNSATSKWISTADIIQTGPPGLYTYSQSFDLTGYDLSSVAISGQWAGDDAIVDIKVNGISFGTNGVGGGTISGSSAYHAFHPFTIATGSSAYQTGINTIGFVTNNADDVLEGLRCELSGTANLVPEPSTFAILGALGFVAVLRRRR